MKTRSREFTYEQPDLILLLRFVETMNEMNEKKRLESHVMPEQDKEPKV